jgi:hypothetical protein
MKSTVRDIVLSLPTDEAREFFLKHWKPDENDPIENKHQMLIEATLKTMNHILNRPADELEKTLKNIKALSK